MSAFCSHSFICVGTVGIPYKQAFFEGEETNDAVQVVNGYGIVHLPNGSEAYNYAWYMLQIFDEVHTFALERNVKLHLGSISSFSKDDSDGLLT